MGHENWKDYPDWRETKLINVCDKKSSNISANQIKENNGKYIIYGAAGVYKNIDFFTEEVIYISIIKDGSGVGRVMLCEPKTSVLGTLDIIINKENCDINFLLNILKRINFRKYKVGGAIPHIYFKDYANEKIKLPLFEEQKKIGSFLKYIELKINQIGRKLQITKEFKKGLLQKMFV